MKNHNKFLPIWSLVAVMAGASQNVAAHTGVKDKGTEGTTLYTAFTLTHGCASNELGHGATEVLGVDGNTAQLPVIAQTVLFPNASDAVFGKVDSAGYIAEELELSDYIQGAVGNILPLSPTVILPQPFPNTYVVREPAGSNRGTGGTTRGFQGWGTSIPEGGGTLALAPFRVAGLKFVEGSCAKTLKVQIAVANFCHTGGQSKDNASDRADIWIGEMTSKFNDPLLMPNAEGTTVSATDTRDKIYWPTLTIERDLDANPLPAGCGDGFDVAIHPSNADIDANLPLATPRKGYKLPGKKFWPTKQ